MTTSVSRRVQVEEMWSDLERGSSLTIPSLVKISKLISHSVVIDPPDGVYWMNGTFPWCVRYLEGFWMGVSCETEDQWDDDIHPPRIGTFLLRDCIWTSQMSPVEGKEELSTVLILFGLLIGDVNDLSQYLGDRRWRYPFVRIQRLIPQKVDH